MRIASSERRQKRRYKALPEAAKGALDGKDLVRLNNLLTDDRHSDAGACPELAEGMCSTDKFPSPDLTAAPSMSMMPSVGG